MKSSVQHTLALLRNQRLKTLGQPCPERVCPALGAIRPRAQTRGRGRSRVALWVVLAAAGALSCFLLVTGGRADAPTITIVTPIHKSTVPAGDIPVFAQVTGVELAKTNTPSGYHLHYYFDANPPTVPGKPAITTVGSWASTVTGSYVWKNVAAGTHVLSVQLVRGDDTPLAPAVTSSVTVRAESPTPQPSLPSSSAPRPPSRGS